MKSIKIIFLGLLLTIFVLVALVLLIPVDRYIPEVEKQLSAEIGRPVRIGRMSVALLPSPHLKVNEVKMGQNSEVVLDSVDVSFDVAALSHRRCLINSIVVNQGALAEAPTNELLAWMTSTDMNSDAPICKLQGLNFDQLTLQIPDFPLGGLRGDVSFDEFNNPTGIKLYVPRFDLTADIGLLPDGSVRIAASTPGWEMAEIPDLRLEQVRAEGVIEGDAFNMQKLSAQLLGVGLSGRGRLDWSKNWDLRGEVDVSGEGVHQPLKALDNRMLAFGKVHGTAYFSARAPEPENLVDHLLLEGDISSSDFALQVDPKVQAMLKMDQFNTHLAYNADAIRLQHVDARLAGGSLTGAVTLLPESSTLRLDLTTRGLNPQPVVRAFNGSLVVSGVLDADVRGILNLERLGDFPVASRIEGKFRMQDGELSEAKLLSAVNQSIEKTAGDKIQFKDVGSDVVIDGAGYHMKNLKLAASLFSGDGYLNISAQEHLEGKLETGVQGTSRLISLPLQVSGTIEEPIVRPAGAVVAGAAIGTALLGPVGAAIGIKAGDLLDRAMSQKNAPNAAAASAVVATDALAVSGWSGGALPSIKPMPQPERLAQRTKESVVKVGQASRSVTPAALPAVVKPAEVAVVQPAAHLNEGTAKPQAATPVKPANVAPVPVMPEVEKRGAPSQASAVKVVLPVLAKPPIATVVAPPKPSVAGVPPTPKPLPTLASGATSKPVPSTVKRPIASKPIVQTEHKKIQLAPMVSSAHVPGPSRPVVTQPKVSAGGGEGATPSQAESTNR